MKAPQDLKHNIYACVNAWVQIVQTQPNHVHATATLPNPTTTKLHPTRWIPNTLLKSKRHSLHCHDFPGSRIPTALVHQCCRFQSLCEDCRREWNWQRNWQSVNQHSWDPWQWTTWSRRVTSDFNSVLKLKVALQSSLTFERLFKWQRYQAKKKLTT